MKCLLGIDVLEITGAELGELKKLQKSPRHLEKFIPEYCLKSDNRIGYVENDLQFIESGDEVYYLFDIICREQPLADEINEMGIDSFKDDFSIIKTLPNVIKFKDRHSYNSSDFLLFDVIYESSYDDYSGGTEWDVEVVLIGYLNAEKEIVYQ